MESFILVVCNLINMDSFPVLLPYCGKVMANSQKTNFTKFRKVGQHFNKI